MLIAHLIFLSLSSGIFAHPTAEDQIDFINEDANPNVVAYVPEATENKAVEQNNDFTISLAAGTSPAEQAPAEPAKDPSCPTDTPYPMTCGGPEVQASEETKEILNCDSGSKKSISTRGRFRETFAVAHLCCQGNVPWGEFYLVSHCSYKKDSPQLEQWSNYQFYEFDKGNDVY